MTPGSVAMLLGETTGLRVQTIAPSLGAANVRIQGLRGRYAQLLADGLPLYGAGGDSLNLLQVPPLDLGQVEVIKGAASALYGPAALGGVINLVSRRPAEAETEALAQRHLAAGRRRHVLAGLGAGRRTELDAAHRLPRPAPPGSRRRRLVGPARLRCAPSSGRASASSRTPAAALFVTGGAIVERRTAAPSRAPLAPDGAPFAQDLDTFRADARRRRPLGVRPAAVRRPRLLRPQRPAPHLRRRRRARHAPHRVRRRRR